MNYGLEWAERKRKYFKDYGKRCEICNSTAKVELHHLTYDHEIGSEPDHELMALCQQHHYNSHDDSHLQALNAVKNMVNGVKNPENTAVDWKMCHECLELNPPEQDTCQTCHTRIT